MGSQAEETSSEDDLDEDTSGSEDDLDEDTNGSEDDGGTESQAEEVDDEDEDDGKNLRRGLQLYEQNAPLRFTDNDEVARILNDAMSGHRDRKEQRARRARYAACAKTAVRLVQEELERAEKENRKPSLHIITFHLTKEQCKLFAELIRRLIELEHGPQWGVDADGAKRGRDGWEWNVDYMTGDDSMPARRKKVRDFEEHDIAFLCTCRCCDEGVDIPVCNGVFFVHPVTGEILATQRVGRALRRHASKDGRRAMVILPAVLTRRRAEDGTWKTPRNNREFQDLQRILRQLADKDGAIVESFQVLEERIKLAEGGKGKGKERGAQDAKEDRIVEIETDEFFRDFVLDTTRRLVGEGLKEGWEIKVDKLKKFLEDHKGEEDKWPKWGGKRPGEKELAQWISTVRSGRNGKGSLRVTEEMEKALEQIGGWNWGVQLSFEERVVQLKKFLEDHAGEEDKWPKRGGTRPGEKELAKWISTVRQGRNGNGNYKVTDERAAVLEKIVGWKWDEKKKVVPFEERVVQLKAFLEDHAGAEDKWPKGGGKRPGEKELANWISDVRKGRKGKGTTKVTDEKADFLEKEIPEWKWVGDRGRPKKRQ